MDSRGSIFAAFVAAMSLFLLALTPASQAQVKPGELIGPDNAAKAKELVPPGVYQRIVMGMQIKVAPTERIDWPPPYQEATEKYSSQVRLSRDGRSLVGYVAGQPFPIIDPNDPNAGAKLMWNVAFRPISSDDYDLRWFHCESVYPGRNHKYFVIDRLELGHYAGYNLVGRTEVEPTPIDPDFKLTGRYYLALLYPVLAPAEDRGSGLIKYRYADPKKADDLWSYTPGARRVRRLNYTILDTATGPQAYDPNNWEGFSAKREYYNYRFLGEKTMLSPIDVGNDTQHNHTCPTDGGASWCPTPWQLRSTYIIEAVPRREIFETLYSKQVVYVDSEADFPMFIDMYDRRGHLFKNYTSWMSYADRARPDSRVAIYPFKREFQVGSSTIDVQGGLSTVCYHPSYDAPNGEAWYINMGEVDKDWFTYQRMQQAALGGGVFGH